MDDGYQSNYDLAFPLLKKYNMNATVFYLGINAMSIFKTEKKQISQTFQRWLLVCIVIAFVATSSFASVLQTGMSEVQTNKTIKLSLGDVYQDILDESNDNLLKKTVQIF